MARAYTILDVFTDTPLAGNPLAVVHDGAGLSDTDMQAIAREFNLSETVFVLPAENPAHTAALRIFTTVRELPFAGHPTVGAAVHLARATFGDVETEQDAIIVMEEKIGIVRAGVVLKSGPGGFSEFDIPQLPTALEAPEDKDLVAAALGLEPMEIGFENHRPTAYNAGNSFAFVPVRDLDAIARAHPVMESWDDGFGADCLGAFLYCRETQKHDSAFHARMFAPKFGVFEDPATGSAAAAFAGPILQFDQPTDGDHDYLIEQGYEMGRPSHIRLGLSIDAGALHAARIGGDAVVVARGTLEL